MAAAEVQAGPPSPSAAAVSASTSCSAAPALDAMCRTTTPRPGSSIKLRVRTSDQREFETLAASEMTIAQIKEQLAPLSGVPSEQQCLLFKGRETLDSDVISTYVPSGSHSGNLFMVVRFPAPEDSATGSSSAPRVVLRGTITIPLPERDVHRVVSSILGSRSTDLNELVDTVSPLLSRSLFTNPASVGVVQQHAPRRHSRGNWNSTVHGHGHHHNARRRRRDNDLHQSSQIQPTTNSFVFSSSESQMLPPPPTLPGAIQLALPAPSDSQQNPISVAPSSAMANMSIAQRQEEAEHAPADQATGTLPATRTPPENSTESHLGQSVSGGDDSGCESGSSSSCSSPLPGKRRHSESFGMDDGMLDHSNNHAGQSSSGVVADSTPSSLGTSFISDSRQSRRPGAEDTTPWNWTPSLQQPPPVAPANSDLTQAASASSSFSHALQSRGARASSGLNPTTAASNVPSSPRVEDDTATLIGSSASQNTAGNSTSTGASLKAPSAATASATSTGHATAAACISRQSSTVHMLPASAAESTEQQPSNLLGLDGKEISATEEGSCHTPRQIEDGTAPISDKPCVPLPDEHDPDNISVIEEAHDAVFSVATVKAVPPTSRPGSASKGVKEGTGVRRPQSQRCVGCIMM